MRRGRRRSPSAPDPTAGRGRTPAGRTWSRCRSKRAGCPPCPKAKDEDEVAGAALDHRREQRLRHQHRRLEVDPQRPDHLFRGEVIERAGAGQARVGDEDVHVPRLGGQQLAGARLGEVGRQGPVAVARQLGGERLQGVALAGAEEDGRPLVGHGQGDRPAEASRGPGEQRCLTGKFHPRPQATNRAAERIEGSKRTGLGMRSAKSHKMFVSYEQATRRSSTLPPFQITETPNPKRSEAPWERGNHVFGANPPHSGGGASSFRASPTANPVGRRRRSVCFRTPISSKRG